MPHLDTFAKAAEMSSFTAAARALGLTQAAVSQRIQGLEKSVGVSLFDRQGGRILLTEAGQRLYDYAQQILALHREARRTVAGEEAEVTGELSLAASTVPGEHLLPALLAVFHERYPGIQLKADISDSSQVIRQVERGEVHLGLVGKKDDGPHLEFHHFATDRMVLAVPPQHAWSKRKRISLEQLCGEPLILREEGSGLRHCFEKSLGRRGKSVRDLTIVLELGSNEAIKEAVMRGIGVAILSRYAVEKELKAGKLRALAVSGLHCDREIFLVWNSRRALPPPARVFRFFVEAQAVPPTP